MKRAGVQNERIRVSSVLLLRINGSGGDRRGREHNDVVVDADARASCSSRVYNVKGRDFTHTGITEAEGAEVGCRASREDADPGRGDTDTDTRGRKTDRRGRLYLGI